MGQGGRNAGHRQPRHRSGTDGAQGQRGRRHLQKVPGPRSHHDRAGDRRHQQAVAGTVRRNRWVQAATLGWREVELAGLQNDHRPALPLLVGNDATLTGVAEARRGALSTARAVLYVTVEVGVGGILVEGGAPVTGATGAAGEFGHLPFGDPALDCPCGARGCWDLEVDGRAMARHRGVAPPVDPWSYAVATLAEAAYDRAAAAAVDRCATAFGSGLVNAFDPDTITLGGLAVPLQRHSAAGLNASYIAGLMAFRRATPPPLLAASLGAEGPLLGAAEVGFDTVLTDNGLADWSVTRPATRR
jgi:predicted NBD/HSP70 family sugar kinase